MGKIAEAYSTYFDMWNLKQFDQVKEQAVYQTNTWGKKRESILNTFCTLINEMEFYEKRKRFSSLTTQMDLYFNWISQVYDNRTRRIVAAHLIDYWKPIEKEEYQKVKEKKETKVETVKALAFPDLKISTESDLITQALFDFDNPVERYINWIENGKEEERSFALKYGTITDEHTYFVKNATMHHDFYTKTRAKKYLSKDYKDKIDAYHNTSIVYGIPSKRDFARVGSRVTEFCLLFAEMDYYKLDEYKHLSQNEMLQIIFDELDQQGFPRPTEVIYPRGLHLIWRTNPIPSYRAIEWEIMQKKIFSILKKFGMDKQTVTDKVRLLRLVGTIHGKTGKKVFGYSYTADRYSFDELLMKYCATEVEVEKERREKAREKYAKQKAKKLQVVEGKLQEKISTAERKKNKNDYTAQDVSALIYERYLHDLFLLVQLRDGKMYGDREFLCFLVRWFSLVVNKGNEFRAYLEMQRMFYALDIQGDYTLDQINVFTRSAVKAYEKFQKNWRDGYNYKSTTLVERLEITPEEQAKMKSLFGEEEGKKRDRVRKQTDKTVSNQTLEAEIRKWILKYPTIGAEKLAEMIRKEIGKCSKSKVLSVKKAMKEVNEI